MCVFNREDLQVLMDSGKRVAIRHRWLFGIFEDSPCGKLASGTIQIMLPLNKEDIEKQVGANALYATFIQQYGNPSETVVCVFDLELGDFLPLDHNFVQLDIDQLEQNFMEHHHHDHHDHDDHQEGEHHHPHE